jgi:hypothetical protein
MLPNADDKRKLNVSKEKVRGKKEEIIYKEGQYTLFLDSGASVIKKGRITRRARHVDKY